MSDRVVARIRATLGSAVRRGQIPDATTAHPGPRPPATASALPPGEHATGGLDLPGAESGRRLLERFRQAVDLVGGTVRVVESMDDAIAGVRELVHGAISNGIGRFVAWDDELVAPVAEALEKAGWERVAQALPATGDDRAARLHELAECAVGVTSAVAALAETGSIVVATHERRGRLASLLPPIHIAVVPVGRIQPSLATWLRGLDPTGVPSSLVIVTGPSRTADIEQTLTRGVHGPKALHIIVVPA